MTDTLTHRKIFTFWAPLASTWLMMAAEGPYLAAIIARLDAPTINLAAFGVAFAFAIIIESPVIMLMSASTALVEDRESYQALRRFSYGLGVSLTLLQLVIVASPIFVSIASLLALPPDVTTLARGGLLLMLPWPGAIAYRRFRQGVLIRNGYTRRVAYGTVIRLVAMSVTAWTLFQHTDLAGAYIGSLALSVAVMVEAIASRVMTIDVLPNVLRRRREKSRLHSLRLNALSSFYAPLALTSFMALAAQPTVTFFMGQSRYALESLAVLPVIQGLSFVFRSAGLSYLEVVIALLGPERQNLAKIRNCACVLGIGAAAGLSLIAFTPLAQVWFRDISGLNETLTQFAVVPIQILAILPALSVLLAFERGLLVHARRNAAITWATLVELVTLTVVIGVAINVFDMVGAVAATTAILVGRVASTGWMASACFQVLRSTPPATTEIVTPPTPEAT